MNLNFDKKIDEVNNICKQSLDLLLESDNEKLKGLCYEFENFIQSFRKENKLTISFIGQYNAGKSSLIVALTKAVFDRRDKEIIDNEEKLVDIYKIQNKEIKVGPQVLTDKTEKYEFNDVLIIDTPGVYAGKKDHDSKTFEQILNSDLIVFVVSNQLFNEVGGNFFRQIAYKMKKEKQILSYCK